MLKIRDFNVLLVDDSTYILYLSESIIKAEEKKYKGLKCNITQFERVKQFKENYIKHNEKYDLAVLDWNLPDGLGSEIVDILKSENPERYSGKIVIFTGMNIDANIAIGQYSNNQNIFYIAKGDESNPLSQIIERSIYTHYRDEKNK